MTTWEKDRAPELETALTNLMRAIDRADWVPTDIDALEKAEYMGSSGFMEAYLAASLLLPKADTGGVMPIVDKDAFLKSYVETMKKYREVLVGERAMRRRAEFWTRHKWLDSSAMRPEVYCAPCVEQQHPDPCHSWTVAQWRDYAKEELEREVLL